MRTTRRQFFTTGAALSVAPALAAGPDRPNILFAISDDQSFAHTGASGDPVVRTPIFDRVAAEGVRFSQAYCCSPSCTPSRSAILTGQEPYRLEEAGNLWSTLRSKFDVYPDMLEAAGYEVGFTRKGWGPGIDTAGGRSRNPAGERFDDFGTFFSWRQSDQPFCFWFGSQDPHRVYEKGSGLRAGMNIDDVRVPDFLPDVPEVRSDILDYFFEIERFDRELGAILKRLEHAGELDNTLVIVTSDNGMPFPRAKANLYDYGARMPLAIRWPERVPGGRVVDDFMSFADFAPTILEAAGVERSTQMTGKSLLSTLTSNAAGRVDKSRDQVVVMRERHTIRRAGGVGYPMRAIRTYEHLYIRNYEPERGPAGESPSFAEIDDSPSKRYLIDNRDSAGVDRYFEMAFGKRPGEELYDTAFAGQLDNLAGRDAYYPIKADLRARLDAHLKMTGDPRASGTEAKFDSYPFYSRSGIQPANGGL